MIELYLLKVRPPPVYLWCTEPLMKEVPILTDSTWTGDSLLLFVVNSYILHIISFSHSYVLSNVTSYSSSMSIYLYVCLQISREITNREYYQMFICVCMWVCMHVCLCDYSHTVQPRAFKFWHNIFYVNI